MAKEILVTTSTGLVADATGNHFLQLIHDREDEGKGRQDILICISKAKAKHLSRIMDLAIERWANTAFKVKLGDVLTDY